MVPTEARLKYIGRRRTDLGNCNKALQQRNFEFLARVAHQIKGNSATFGYIELGAIALQLEESTEPKDTFIIKKVLAQFPQFLSKFSV